MIKNKKKFNDALAIVLAEDGMILQASAEVYIRSLEGPTWCVGNFEEDGDMDMQETIHESDLESALARFHQLVEDKGLA